MTEAEARELFEQWAKFDPKGCGSVETCPEGRYENRTTRLCFRAFKAALREAGLLS